jgi:hypothetical protein
MTTVNHVCIAGVGRSGTTFLIRLLSRLGCDTGFTGYEPEDDRHHAGLEKITLPWSEIVKSPVLCDLLPNFLDQGVSVRHVIIPIRRLDHAAESRRRVQRESGTDEAVDAGLWRSSPESQENVLATQLYALMVTLSDREIPFTFISFPRLATDCDYLLSSLKLIPRLITCSDETFRETFNALSRPEWIHFGEDNEASS